MPHCWSMIRFKLQLAMLSSNPLCASDTANEVGWLDAAPKKLVRSLKPKSDDQANVPAEPVVCVVGPSLGLTQAYSPMVFGGSLPGNPLGSYMTKLVPFASTLLD